MNLEASLLSKKERFKKVFLIIVFLYLFLTSISLMGSSLKLFGKGFSKNLISTTSNPAVGLMIGLLATAIIQSSSTTTSIVVGFVACGTLSIRSAVPIVMGANIGTTVTSFLVSFCCITRKDEFERAIAGATVHDFFNILTVFILFPLEITTHFLEKTAQLITGFLGGVGQGAAFESPVKIVVTPCVTFCCSMENRILGDMFIGKILLLIFSLIIVFISLYYLVRIMKTLVLKRTEIVFHNIVGRNAFLGIIMGMIFTAFIQSSSVSVSILVTLIAAGVISLEDAFPLTLGANVGTTITAILASLSGETINGLTIAIVHLFFNIVGILIIYPFKPFRRIPIFLAKKMGVLAIKSRIYPIIFLIGIYFFIPGLLVFIFR
ncbi:MAG: Na/Pi symporter [Candidatus Aureabacteria bacterium]|nr:Na/Pi symporter [Candidatus Auribacterota bacterium]